MKYEDINTVISVVKPKDYIVTASSIGAGIGSMTSQNGGQDGRHGPKMATTTSDDPVTRSVSPRRVS